MTRTVRPAPLWTPNRATTERSAIAAFAGFAAATRGAPITDPNDYPALWRWSVENVEQYWTAVWDFFELESPTPYTRALSGPDMPGAVWFQGASVNYAQHALRQRRSPDEPALICLREDGTEETLSWGELTRQVSALAATLRSLGYGLGDRVAAYLPPGPQAVVGFLAAASIGAVWSQVGQDFGAQAAIDRFEQFEPAVLIVADGYQYNGRTHDRRDESSAIAAVLCSVHHVIHVTRLGTDTGSPADCPWDLRWDDAISGDSEPSYAQVPFDHPLWVLFTSGTTGRPKGIVHSHGGITLAMTAHVGLQMDLGTSDRLLWYSNTTWVMWNVAVSALLTGATVIFYDGSPSFPGTERLWEITERYGVTFLGTSPAYLRAAERVGLRPGTEYDLSALRTLGVTGSPLPAATYHWAAAHVGPRIQVASTSGGTDVAVAFASAAPTTPVWAGELSAPCLGVALEAWDEQGRPVTDEVGELVVTRPMPSMPLGLWDDGDGSRYRETYFSHFPGVWRHGDWITITADLSVVVHGRSDATLNRNGIRLGSAEIYAAVEALPEITDALVVGVEKPDGDYWMPLFVVLADGPRALDEELRRRIRTTVRRQASPRHVPDEILAIEALPRTRTGKKLEVPVKRILQGARPTDVVSMEALDRPEALAQIVEIAQSQR